MRKLIVSALLLFTEFSIHVTCQAQEKASTRETDRPAAETANDDQTRHFKFHSEEEARKSLADAILKGMIPINHVPPKVTTKEKEIFAALEATCTVDFRSTPLKEAITTLAKAHAIPILINTKELEIIGVDPATPVSLELKEVRLRSALRYVLDVEPEALIFVVRNDVLEITSFDCEPRISEVYRIPQKLCKDTESLVKILEQSIEPDEWVSAGGRDTMLMLDNLLIVSTSLSTQYKIQDLLSKIVDKYGVGIDEL